jgi:hypothetical protein
MKTLLVILTITFLSFTAFSHEGHNDTPGAFKSLHGGTVQNGKQLNLEVVVSGREITIFPTSHDGKDIQLSDVKIESLAKPKKGKAYSVTFSPAKNGLSATIDLKGANRIPVEITVTGHGKTDHFLVQVEE